MQNTKLGRITLDLPQLIAKGQIDHELAKRLDGMKLPSSAANHLISTLYIIGALAAAAGIVLLKPTATTGLVIAIICLICGQYIRLKHLDHLKILSLALGIGSAAGLIGWFVMEFGGTLPALAINGFATAVTLMMALLFHSRFLAALVPIGIGTMIGSGGGYWHASYGIFVKEPTVTIIIFSGLAVGFYFLSKRFLSHDEDFRTMATVVERMSLIIANFGFWVGSLWGDYIGNYLSGVAIRIPGQDYDKWKVARDAFRVSATHVPDYAFALLWSLFALSMIVIGNKIGNRYTAICGVVFLAINAFTQYFEYFKDEPWALIFGGIFLVAIALGLVRYEFSLRKRPLKFT